MESEDMSPDRGSGEAGTPRLDPATHTVRESNKRWQVTVYESAGEIVGSWIPDRRPPDQSRNVPYDGPVDPERSRSEAARRAKTAIRRYVTTHRLSRIITLTYAPDHLPEDLEGGWRHIEDFRRQVGEHFGPMLIVPEWGEENGRLHWHVLVNKFMRKAQVAKAWGLGFVDVRRIQSTKKRGGQRAAARTAAAYAGKYVSKTFDEGQEGRKRHGKRYSTTRGTQPVPGRWRYSTAGEASSAAVEYAGGLHRLTATWSSDEVEDWAGPPVWLMFWDDGPP